MEFLFYARLLRYIFAQAFQVSHSFCKSLRNGKVYLTTIVNRGPYNLECYLVSQKYCPRNTSNCRDIWAANVWAAIGPMLPNVCLANGMASRNISLCCATWDHMLSTIILYCTKKFVLLGRGAGILT